MSKMSLHDPFGYLKHKLWPKEKPEVKLPIWFLTTESQESPKFPCVQVAYHILLKSSQQGLQLFFRPQLNRRSTHKAMGLQNCKSRNFGKFGNPGTKWHLNAGPVAKHKEYYKGEGGGLPQVRAVVSLMNPCLLVVRSCTQNVPTTH
jgi:hypothetical protein